MTLSYQLKRPFAFLWIEHPVLKPITWYAPTVAAILVVGIFFLFPEGIKLFGERSYTSYTISVISTLPGFFIAALAAVATFSRVELDDEIKSPPATLKIMTLGQLAPTPLTYRVFLCYMFAYLTAASLLIIVTCVFSDLIMAGICDFIRGLSVRYMAVAFQVLKGLYVFIISWFNASIFIITFYSLYFLCERIHRADN